MIHKTLGLMPWTLKWLQNPKAFASAHYLITKKGVIHQLVQLKDRSWSAGRIYKPNAKARKIMIKNHLGIYVKPGHYLIQIEFECLANESFTEDQYKSAAWLCDQFAFDLTDDNLIDHQDTCNYKPQLEKERQEILNRLNTDVCDHNKLVLDNWQQLRIKTEGGKIVISKQI